MGGTNEIGGWHQFEKKRSVVIGGKIPPEGGTDSPYWEINRHLFPDRYNPPRLSSHLSGFWDEAGERVSYVFELVFRIRGLIPSLEAVTGT